MCASMSPGMDACFSELMQVCVHTLVYAYTSQV